MKCSYFAKISRLFQTSILLHKNIFFAINSKFQLSKDRFSKYHLMYYAGSDLGLIILKWNDINKVAVTDLTVRNRCIAKKFWTISNYKRSFCLCFVFINNSACLSFMFCFCWQQCLLLKKRFSLVVVRIALNLLE